MKKVNLLAAAVLAAAFAMPAQADFTPNVNFSGYMRSGVMHGNSALGSKTEVQRLGRLGNENDTFMEFGLGADVDKVDDVTYSVFGMITHGGDGNEKDWNTNLACRQAWASAKNLLGQGWRLINFGDVHFTKEFGMFHVAQYAHSSGFNSYDSERSVNLVVRPYYQFTKMTKLLAEVGWFADKKSANTDDKGVQSYVSKHGSKYTLAYAISPDASNFWSRSEFRFYVSHVSVSDNMNIGPTHEWVRQTSDNMFDAQVEAWW